MFNVALTVRITSDIHGNSENSSYFLVSYASINLYAVQSQILLGVLCKYLHRQILLFQIYQILLKFHLLRFMRIRGKD